ncbi:MAG TPA: hypothetical protein VGF06_05990 [Terriglobales bacterium]|jgi:hypothetical protein
MQPKLGSDSLVVIGQLLDSKHPDQALKNVRVSLQSERGTIARSKTNRVGEFEFRVEAFSGLQLAFAMGARRTVVVPVPEIERVAEPAAV